MSAFIEDQRPNLHWWCEPDTDDAFECDREARSLAVIDWTTERMTQQEYERARDDAERIDDLHRYR